VRIENYPHATDETYTIPVNGLKNFNFYYNQNGTGFLPAGGYTVTYLSSSFGYLAHETITYSPNSGHTNGNAVRAFNSPPDTPRGMHGLVYGRIGENVYPIPNAIVYAYPYFTFGSFAVQARTNADGYFSIYTKNGSSAEFLPVYYGTTPPAEYYSFHIQGDLNGCLFIETRSSELWQPDNTTDPSNSSYFVTEAETDLNIPILDPVPNSCP